MRDHHKLKVFALADQLVQDVYILTKGFPKDERFGLTNQIRRAAVSIPSNIVEGCARASQAEYARFLEIALGSAQEVRYQLGLSVRLGFVDPAEAADGIGLADQTCKALNGLLCSLAREP